MSPAAAHSLWTAALLERADDSPLPFESAPVRLMLAGPNRTETILPDRTNWSDVYGWSPDGTRFLAMDREGTTWTVELDGRAEARQWGGAGAPIWRGDSEIAGILATGDNRGTVLMRIDARTGAVLPPISLPTDALGGAISPDGVALAYQTGGQGTTVETLVFDLNTSRLEGLGQGSLLVGWTDQGLAYLRDGALLLWSSGGRTSSRLFADVTQAVANSEHVVLVDRQGRVWVLPGRQPARQIRISIGLSRISGVSRDGRFLSVVERVDAAPPAVSRLRSRIFDTVSGSEVIPCRAECARLRLR